MFRLSIGLFPKFQEDFRAKGKTFNEIDWLWDCAVMIDGKVFESFIRKAYSLDDIQDVRTWVEINVNKS